MLDDKYKRPLLLNTEDNQTLRQSHTILSSELIFCLDNSIQLKMDTCTACGKSKEYEICPQGVTLLLGAIVLIGMKYEL